MNELHSLLRRQLRRFNGDTTKSLLEEQTDLLRAINDAYWQFDADRRMLEHSLELTSQELLERNAELSRINIDLKIHVARFRELFEHAPVSIWEEDFSAVRQYLDHLRGAGVVDFSAYFDTHPEAVAESVARVKIVDVNRATLEMYQAESKAQLLADLSKVLGPESLIPFKEELLALARGETSFEDETINYTLQGERRVIFLRLTVAPNYEQTWAKVFVGISDITERRQAEDKLEQSETLFRALFDLSPDAVLLIDPHDPNVSWPVIDCNMAACLMNGYRRDELIGHPIDILNVTSDTEVERIAYMKRLRAAGNLKFETHHQRKNGVVFPVEVSTTLIVVGERELVIGIDRDITERKQVEEALRQSEERFKLMAWATIDAVWDWDLQTNQIWWGEGLQKIFYYSSDTTQTNPEWRLDHIHPEDRAKVDLVINQALEGGMEFWSKEYRFQRVDRTYADIMDRGYVIRDAAGKAYRMIGAMMDITERKYMESMHLQSNEKMGQLLNELQERNRDASLLNELSHRLQACQSTQEAYGIIAELSKQLFPQTAGVLYLLNESRNQVSPIAAWGGLTSAGETFNRDNCKAMRRSPTRPLNADQPAMCCLHFTQQPSITYCLPIQVQGETIGIFHLQSTSEENLPENKRQLANTVVEQSQMVLSNLRLREALLEQSIRDPLTELYNRRYMEEALNQQLSRVTRQLHPLGLIMIDIDHFKNFNDAYGHAAGDALLRELGRLLESHIRGGDVACRYGGEEFLIIMPDASLEAARQRALLLQKEAKKLRVQDAGQSLEGITLSLGVAIYPEHGRSIDSVLRAADAALYRAKQEGRDRVVVAERAY